ncbi:MAG: ribosome maturation factor RimM [Melioribacteraceae bacterium]|nr:ribosome maturation factor RimM [Melioribacteraceae bacterium]
MDDYYLIAEVQDVYGKDGAVIIKSYSDFPERFTNLEFVFFDFLGKTKRLEVEFSKEIDGSIILKFRNFDSVEDVLFLIGKYLYITEDILFKLPEHTHYVHDLIDSEVYLESMFFGKLTDVLKLPENDLFVVQKNNGNEIMIPAARKYIDFFDAKMKKLVLSKEAIIFDEDAN